MKLLVHVNGVARELDVDPLRRLLDVLRVDLGLVGTKEGCGEGECGACTVLIGKEAVNSCLVPVCQVHEAKVTTIEAVRDARLENAFAEQGASQCGICTPGMIVATKAFLARCEKDGVAIDEAGVREALAGNLCRCTGYGSIVRAVLACAPREAP